MSTSTADPVAELLSKLEGVRRAGDGYSAKCPAHEDRLNCLSISTGRDGRALVKCHAGCTADSIVAKIGMKMADLFPRVWQIATIRRHHPVPLR